MYGMDVYYAGWLTHVPSMGERMVPMVRSGKLGAWNQPGIPFRPEWMEEDEEPWELQAHLIDCYGYYGFSGSPCFMQVESWTDRGEYDYKTALLGVLVGFFEFSVEDILGDMSVNAGVAIVAPAWRIKEILNREDLMEDRKEREKKREDQPKKSPKPKPGTSASGRPGPDPERLNLEGPWEDAAQRAMEAGKPEDWDEEGEG